MRDFAHAAGADEIDAMVADRALDRLEIDALGLDAMDRRYLTMIADLYGGGPVGIGRFAGRRERDPVLFVQKNNQLIGPIFSLMVKGSF